MSRFSPNLLRNLSSNSLRPIIVLEIKDFPFLIGSDTIKKVARYGDEDLFYGTPELVYGGLFPISADKQKALITTEGITRSISQTLDIDKAKGSGVSTFSITLTDLNGEATKIASGIYDGEILYRDAVIWIGFSENSDFNADYKVLFRGVIESIDFEQAKVKLNFASSDIKRRQSKALKYEGELTTFNPTNVTTSAFNVTDSQLLLEPLSLFNADGTIEFRDPTLLTYVKVNDEYIQYESKDKIIPNTIDDLTRAQFGTTATAHSIGDEVEPLYVLEGHPIDITLKLLLSKPRQEFLDNNAQYLELTPDSVNRLPTGDFIQNLLYFKAINLIRDYNVNIGDGITWVGSSVPENVSAMSGGTIITDVQFVDTGSYVVISTNNSVAFQEQTPSDGDVKFFSQFNTLGDIGLGLEPNEVDIKKFVQLRNSFLSGDEVSFFIRDEISDVREFIESQLLLPFGLYTLPNDKEGLFRLSVGLSIPPLPIEQILQIDTTNIVNPEDITTKRSSLKYHYNGVGYRYGDAIEDEELRTRFYVVVGTPTIPTGNKFLTIEAKGFRDSLGAQQQATTASTRLLNRYKGAAEYFMGLRILPSIGFLLNIGDRVLVNPEGLNITNRITGKRDRELFLAEIVNKKEDPLSGNITIDILDTNFDLERRYGLISPASFINKVITSTRFVIARSFGGVVYGNQEFRKWEAYVGSNVRIRSLDFTDMHETTILSVNNNTITIETAPSFPLAEGYLMEFVKYNEQTSSRVKLIYVHLSDDVNDFADGEPYYSLI